MTKFCSKMFFFWNLSSKIMVLLLVFCFLFNSTLCLFGLERYWLFALTPTCGNTLLKTIRVWAHGMYPLKKILSTLYIRSISVYPCTTVLRAYAWLFKPLNHLSLLLLLLIHSMFQSATAVWSFKAPQNVTFRLLLSASFKVPLNPLLTSLLNVTLSSP